MDSMTHRQFDEWCAYDTIEPIGHGKRMLGFIARALSVYMGNKSSDEDLNAAFTPWIDDNGEPDNGAAVAAIFGAFGVEGVPHPDAKRGA